MVPCVKERRKKQHEPYTKNMKRSPPCGAGRLLESASPFFVILTPSPIEKIRAAIGQSSAKFYTSCRARHFALSQRFSTNLLDATQITLDPPRRRIHRQQPGRSPSVAGSHVSNLDSLTSPATPISDAICGLNRPSIRPRGTSQDGRCVNPPVRDYNPTRHACLAPRACRSSIDGPANSSDNVIGTYHLRNRLNHTAVDAEGAIFRSARFDRRGLRPRLGRRIVSPKRPA